MTPSSPTVTGAQLLDINDNMFDAVQCWVSAEVHRRLSQCLNTVVITNILQTRRNMQCNVGLFTWFFLLRSSSSCCCCRRNDYRCRHGSLEIKMNKFWGLFCVEKINSSFRRSESSFKQRYRQIILEFILLLIIQYFSVKVESLRFQPSRFARNAPQFLLTDVLST